jgi:hypothetical protein
LAARFLAQWIAALRVCEVALLWRLVMLGCEIGDRWQYLPARWEEHSNGKLYAFPDIHAAISELRGGHIDAFERRRKAIRDAAESMEVGAIYCDIGVPVGLTHHGAYAQAVDHLLRLASTYGRWAGATRKAMSSTGRWPLRSCASRRRVRPRRAYAASSDRLKLSRNNGLRRQRLEGERLEVAGLWDDLENPADHVNEEAGLAVVGPEGLLVLRGLDVSDAKRPKLSKRFSR